MDAVLRATCKRKGGKIYGHPIVNFYTLNERALVTEDDADVGTN